MNVFLTPEKLPLFGGTYFPPAPRYGKPAFTNVLREVARIYREEPDKDSHKDYQGLLPEDIAP